MTLRVSRNLFDSIFCNTVHNSITLFWYTNLVPSPPHISILDTSLFFNTYSPVAIFLFSSLFCQWIYILLQHATTHLAVISSFTFHLLRYLSLKFPLCKYNIMSEHNIQRLTDALNYPSAIMNSAELFYSFDY